MKIIKIKPPVQERMFHIPKKGEKKREWRFDFSWPDHKIAVEIDGGVWTNGRHVRGKGYTEDCLKINTATVQGWRVFRFTTQQVISGQSLMLLESFLKENIPFK